MYLKKKFFHFLAYFLVTAILFSPIITGNQLNNISEGELFETLEWNIENPSYTENPFDIIAVVNFFHPSSGKIHQTEMFYSGNDTWKFRFTGIKKGEWLYNTSSNDSELDGYSGNITITDSNNTGFLSHVGNKYALQDGDGTKRGFLLNIFQTDDSGPFKHTHITSFTPNTSEKAYEYITYAKERGFTAVYIMLNNNLHDFGAYGYDEHSSSDPDLQAFEILDIILSTARENNIRVYFWRWGDESRKWTPIGIEGGINGIADERVTRYFAARLGPVPGWSMGYGFDLYEWVSTNELEEWSDYFYEKMGWKHLLSARSYNFSTPDNIISYSQEDVEIDSSFSASGYPSYQEILNDLSMDKNSPHLYEERNTLYRWDVDSEDTRRIMWRTAMAGGMGGWYGFMDEDPVWGSGSGYSNDNALKAHGIFWENHSLLDFVVNNSLSSEDNTRVLESYDKEKYIFYKENASSIQIDLRNMKSSKEARALDTKKAYNETEIGILNSSEHIINLPYTSDWVVSIEFNASGFCGDSICNETENCDDCPEDCGECCGNGVCESSYGEDCSSCPSDCFDSGIEVCCNGTAYTGDCCSDSDCNNDYLCNTTTHLCYENQTQTYHPADTNQDGIVSFSEINSYLERWINEEITIDELLLGINRWRGFD